MTVKLPLFCAAFLISVFVLFQSAHAEKVDVKSHMPVMGGKYGKYQVVEFFDYRCGYCKRMVPVLEEIAQRHPKTQIVLIEYPIFGKESELMAKAALAVHQTKPSMYFKFHTKLMQLKGKANDKSLAKLADSIGINGAELMKEAKKSKYSGYLKTNRALAKKYGVSGTPHMVIDGYNRRGAISYDSYKNYYKEIDK